MLLAINLSICQLRNSLLSEGEKETEGRVTDTFYFPFLKSLFFMGRYF